MTNNLRPGVYSRYDISSHYSTALSSRYAAVAAKSSGSAPQEALRFSSYAEAQQALPPDGDGECLLGCVRLLFDCGVSQVVAVAVKEDYAAALALVEEIPNIGAVVCDCTEEAGLAALRDSVHRSSGALRERIAFCGMDDPEAAAKAAKALNSERVVLACPAASPRGSARRGAVYTACALAGAVLAQDDPAHNFNGLRLSALESPDALEESQIQTLLGAGVTVCEEVGGAVECIRLTTTRTETSGEPDNTLRSVNTVLIIDDVMATIRSALKARLGGARISELSYGSIVSQVLVELAAKRESGVIESYEPPKVYGDSADPAVCVVELSFKVAQVLSQIHVVAHIEV